MAWFAELAGKAENLLNNIDEQTGAALRNHNNGVKSKRFEKYDSAIQSEHPWPQKKRPSVLPRKNSPPPKESKSVYSPPLKKQSLQQQSKQFGKQNLEQTVKKSPNRKSNQQYNLNQCPKTLVGDMKERDEIMEASFGIKHRRYSLPDDLLNTESLTYRMQNLEVENAMLKNELNVVNREVSELLERLRKTEDELNKSLENVEKLQDCNKKITTENETLNSHVNELKMKVVQLTTTERDKQSLYAQQMETEMELLRETKRELEDRIRNLEVKCSEGTTANLKVENELRHAQTTILDLQSSLERSNAECQRLERDWERYKVRVKNMLTTKDNEIKSLQEGLNLTEDTKILIDQIDSLKEEREELSHAISEVRAECGNMRLCMEQLEARSCTAERLVAALREALKEERSAKNTLENEYLVLTRQIKSIQIETGQTIASLRSALQEKDNELTRLRETSSQTIATTDTSALNVADYDVVKDVDTDKVQFLTQALFQRQGKIDTLMADNNMLKIQLEKLEAKYNTELGHLKINNNHSIVNVDHDGRLRNKSNKFVLESKNPLNRVALRLGVFLRRYPVFRLFIIMYMTHEMTHARPPRARAMDPAQPNVGLHFWVVTVLLSSTPDVLPKRGS